jgi:hypothetical protein
LSFLDWNNSGGLDEQDIVTSVAIDTAEQSKNNETEKVSPAEPGSNLPASSAGCLTMIMVITICIASLARTIG